MHILSILIIILSTIPLLFTIRKTWRAASIKKNGVYTDGTVIRVEDFKLRRDIGSTRIDIAFFEYKDRTTGKIYTGRAAMDTKKVKFGDKITVAYLPDRPERHMVDSKHAYSNVSLVVLCVMLVAVVVWVMTEINL